MSKVKTGLLWLVIIVLVAFLVPAVSNPTSNRITYADLIAKIKNKEVTDVAISYDKETARVKLKNDETVKRVNISDIENLMTNLNESMQEGTVKVSTDNQPFLETISNWILPISSIVLIFLLWTMLMSFTTMRQGGGQGGQVSFGKSKARMINQEDKTKLTFKDVAGIDEEKEEFEYLFTNEKHKFFIAKLIEDKISVNENDVTKLYTDNKANFDAQNIPFSQAREIIQRDLLNQQVAVLEAEELNKLVEEMEDKLEISKKEILFSKGDSEVLKTLLVGKIISKKMADEKFEDQEQNKKDLEVIRDNVYINYYLDLEVRKNVKVTQEEVAEIYEKEKAKLGNVTPNSAYQQIANSLLNNRAIEERNNLINKIVEEYKVEEVAKEYTEAE